MVTLANGTDNWEKAYLAWTYSPVFNGKLQVSEVQDVDIVQDER